MKNEMMVKALEEVKADVSYRMSGKDFMVTIEDFEGFDEDYNEIDREFVDEDAVDAFIEMLEKKCKSCEGDLYRVYHFNGFDVVVGYASFDI